MTGLARSLPKQKVNKGKVWLIFLAGAGALFGAAIAVERNSKLFPAIAKANQAMTASRSASQVKLAVSKMHSLITGLDPLSGLSFLMNTQAYIYLLHCPFEGNNHTSSNSLLAICQCLAHAELHASSNAAQEREQDQGTIEVEGQPDAEGQEAVLQGLADARSKVQEASPSEEPSRDGTQDHGVGNGAARSYPGIREEHQAKPDVPHNAQNWSAEQEREQIVDQSPPGS